MGGVEKESGDELASMDGLELRWAGTTVRRGPGCWSALPNSGCLPACSRSGGGDEL
jgi:hypothetical protein